MIAKKLNQCYTMDYKPLKINYKNYKQLKLFLVDCIQTGVRQILKTKLKFSGLNIIATTKELVEKIK